MRNRRLSLRKYDDIDFDAPIEEEVKKQLEAAYKHIKDAAFNLNYVWDVVGDYAGEEHYPYLSDLYDLSTSAFELVQSSSRWVEDALENYDGFWTFDEGVLNSGRRSRVRRSRRRR